MNDLVLHIIQVLALGTAWLYVSQAGKGQAPLCRRGWNCVLGGLGLFFIGSLFGLIEHFESLNRLVVSRQTGLFTILQRTVGYSAGGVLLAIGVVRWIPTVMSQNQLRRQARGLAERVKELDCLYTIAMLLEEEDASVQKVVQETLRLIPPAYQYPEITCARVLLSGAVYSTDNFQETYWKQSATIYVADKLAGAIEVCYLQEMPQAVEGPFLLEERRLINSIAERLGKVVAHKRAEARIVSLTREMEFILKATGTGLDIIDEEFNIRYIDGARKERYGDLTRQKCYEYLHGRNAVCDACGVREALLSNSPVVEERTIVEEGSRLVQITSIPFEGEDGKRLVAQVYADITERKRNEDLERSRQVAELANRTKSEFLANMSHEIRTPMTAILGFAEVLRTEGDLSKAPPARIEAIDTVIRNGNYLLELINDILDLSKIESGKLTIERTRCSPGKVVAEVVSLMQVRAKARGLELEVEYLGAIPEYIQSDPTRLRQILINLVGNAIKFTDKGSVRLRVRFLAVNGRGPVLQFDVVDTGIGITDEQISVIFAPFSQADVSTSRTFGGTGLGLTISRRLARMLGGDISVASQPGKGSTFTITVETGPLDGVRLTDNPVQAIGDEEASPASLENVVALDCRILLAEDGPDNQRLISFILKKAGADVVVAENGQIAVDAVEAANSEENPFDLILMDMQMPILDGYDATKTLRAEGYIKPIIAITAHAMKEDRQTCIKAGCDDYVTKPVKRGKLLEIVAKHIERSRQQDDHDRNGPQSLDDTCKAVPKE